MCYDECLKYSKYLYKVYNEMNWMVHVQTIQLRSDGVLQSNLEQHSFTLGLLIHIKQSVLQHA